MTLNIWYASLLAKKSVLECKDFIQKMVNRRIQGQCRYGTPKVEQKYLTRMKKELKAYQKTGNGEQLLNIANYALLEFYYPENQRFHFDANAKSVTRNSTE